jgi:hypothetical protein
LQSFYIDVWLCDRVGQIGESGVLSDAKGVERVVVIWGSKVVAPKLSMSIKDRAVLASMSKFRIVLATCRAFMGIDKLSSLVTSLLNHASLLQGDFI